MNTVGELEAEGKPAYRLIPGMTPGNQTGCIVNEKGIFGEGENGRAVNTFRRIELLDH
jgi:hypothetical protein